MRVLLCLLALCCFALPVLGGGYEWRQNPAAGQCALYRDGVQVGAYDTAGDFYRPYDARSDTWGESGRPPTDPPCRKRVENYGLVETRINQSGERWAMNGAPCSRTDALGALGSPHPAGAVPDDGGKPFVVAIGPGAEGVGRDLGAARDAVRFQAYDPADPMLRDRDGRPTYSTGGKPSVYLVAADGKVVAHDESAPSPELLLAAVRKAREYDPARDASFAAPAVGGPSALNLVLAAAAIGAFCAAGVVYLRRRKA